MPRATPIEVNVPFTENEANWLWEHLSTLDMSHSSPRFAGVVSRILTRLEIGAASTWADIKPTTEGRAIT